jgi:AmmeMemoRadiSam system protein B
MSLRVLLVVMVMAWCAAGLPPRAQTMGGDGVPPRDGLRGLADVHGFATKPEQMDAIVQFCRKLEAERLTSLDKALGLGSDARWVAAVCPHDDYVYAGQVYVDALSRLQAKTVILFGVCHKARQFGLEDKLVFDSYTTWRGPYGPVSVSPLREEIMKLLPAEDYVVSDVAQQSEWSVEAIVPWLQHENRQVAIVSILVPYMRWQRLDDLARNLGKALAGVVKKQGLSLGNDLAFVMSTDATHYGDQWDDWAYSPFGCSVDGYLKAQAQDECLIRWYLDGKLDRLKMQRLSETLVDQDDVTRYKVTWCGRFSVPLGLTAMTYLMEDLGLPPLEGANLGYGTSIGYGFLPFDKLGLSATAHENLHHWVSYVAEGYR